MLGNITQLGSRVSYYGVWVLLSNPPVQGRFLGAATGAISVNLSLSSFHDTQAVCAGDAMKSDDPCRASRCPAGVCLVHLLLPFSAIRSSLVIRSECYRAQVCSPTPPGVEPESCSFPGNGDWLSAQRYDRNMPEHACSGRNAG